MLKEVKSLKEDINQAVPNNLESYWMPYTTNRRFKKNPKFFVAAKDMYYTTSDNRKVLDGMAGLWCVNAGHCRPRIVQAVQNQVAEMDYSTAFNMGHPKAFTLANKLAEILPKDIDQVFYTNSGSEAVDTALKMALAYHSANGDSRRIRLIGRARGYHGVGFGGMSVGGMVVNRKQFPNHLPGVDHLQDTHIPEKNAFSKGQPKYGAERAHSLIDLINLHDASTIAAVIVEPVACSTGVLVPPIGYLEELREICTKHGILLIFDEVICGFGRMGKAFAADKFNVIPDIMTMAKGITNATIPMGAVATHKKIYDAMMNGPEHIVELFHGYTYSGHPLACSAALATLEEYEAENLFEKAGNMESFFEEAAHSLKDLDNVVDIRTIGLAAGIELKSRDDGFGKRAYDVFDNCFENNLLTRFTGETIAISPPLMINKGEVKTIFDTLRSAILEVK
tara:strand:- start:643 stop:1995 length:1353 start_codon:yes stop_codon:yes gene_type:complete